MLTSTVQLRPVCSASSATAVGNLPCRAHVALSRNQIRKPKSTSISTASCLVGQAAFHGTTLSARHPGRTVARGPVLVRSEQVDFKDRALSTLPYLVPLFDGLRYGKFALASTPFLYTLLSPLDPLLRLYLGIPFASLIVFFAIYLGIVNNQNLSRYVRINAMQAVLLDILLILPGVFERVIKGPPTDGFGLTIYMNVYNTIFWFVLVCWLYGTVSCILGRAARLPLVGEAAEQQIR